MAIILGFGAKTVWSILGFRVAPIYTLQLRYKFVPNKLVVIVIID